MLHTPAANAPREVPTPLVFVSASGWDPESRKGMHAFAAWYAQRGYTCMEIDLGRPEGAKTSDSLMQHFEGELASHVRLAAIPFAPVVVARAASALIAQAYISSHPASGLLLVSPPASNASARPELLPTPLKEFDFEPRFPCAILCSQAEVKVLEGNSRLWNDPGVDRLLVKSEEDIDGAEGRNRMEVWFDEIGI